MTDPVTIHHVYVNLGYDGTDWGASYTGGDEALLRAKRFAVALVEKAADRGYTESVYIETHQSGPDGRMEMVDRWDAPSVPRKPELPREYVDDMRRYEERKVELERVRAELDPVARLLAESERIANEPEPEPEYDDPRDRLAFVLTEAYERGMTERADEEPEPEPEPPRTKPVGLKPGWFNTLFMNLPQERNGYGVMRKEIRLDDGFSMSIQASQSHYSEPRDNTGPYTAYEIGYPDEHFEALRPYADGAFPSSVYGWVPAEVIEAVFEERGWSRYYQYLPQPKPASKSAPHPEGQLASRLMPHPELTDLANRSGLGVTASFFVLLHRTIDRIEIGGDDIAELERRDDDGERYGAMESIEFFLSDGTQYRMTHMQDCCESVILHDVAGSLHDLLGQPVVMAEEATSGEDPPNTYTESHTWTFYKLATIKGYVTLRWIGESNGYYSESVSFRRIR